MKDIRSSLLLVLAGLCLVSIGLLLAALYHFNYSPKASNPASKPNGKKPAVAAFALPNRDSLTKEYRTTVSFIDAKLDSLWNNADSLNENLSLKLSDFYRLRKEIAAILKDSSQSANLGMAQTKIQELQNKVASLVIINQNVETENQRLTRLLNEMNRRPAPEKNNTSSNIPYPVATAPAPVNNKPATETAFSISDMKLSAWQLVNETEKETNSASQAEKFTGSMVVKNNGVVGNTSELVIVVLQPDGKVLQNSSWDVGTFQTPEGKKIYSNKLRFDYKKGESKKLQFSLAADEYPEGTYQLMVYQNGNLIGKMNKSLF